MQRFITEDYESAKQKSKFTSWISLKLACEREGLVAPSYRTFRLAIAHRPPHERVLKRQGRRLPTPMKRFTGTWNRRLPGTVTGRLKSPISTTPSWMLNWSLPTLAVTLAAHG